MGLARDVMLSVEEPETNELVDSGWEGDGRDEDMVTYRRRGWPFYSEANAILLDVNLASRSSKAKSIQAA